MTATIARRRRMPRLWLVAGILLIAATIAVALIIANPGPRAVYSDSDFVTVSRGDITSRISGTGTIAAADTLLLAFQTSGTVTEVLVEPGDRVEPGQELARLDDRALQIQLANAQASLVSAEALLTQAREGNASPQDLASAQAALVQAQANYDKVVSEASAGDIAAAQAAVASAQSAYQAAVASAGASDSNLESARASLRKAEIALQQAQVNYADALDEDSTDTKAAAAYQSALVDYQQAKANYDTVAATSDVSANSSVQSAWAALEQARANLAKLTDPAAAEDIASAQASVDQAAANLAKLTSPATDTSIAIQEASVTQARLAVQQAELNLEYATLTAPFAGVITAVDIVVGSQASAASPAVSLMDTSTMHIDLRLNENDVADVSLGQEVRIRVGSLGDWETTGEVDYIAPASETVSGVVTYATRVTFVSDDERLKVGMTANIDIITASREDVLLVPSTALLPNGAGYAVQVPSEDGTGLIEVGVQTGVGDNSYTEIISGLQQGDRIVALPSSGTQSGGMFSAMRGG